MITKIDKAQRMGKQHGGFGIQILYPGIVLPESKDTGFAGIGRIDHAKVLPGTLIPMHPHVDDEILTYLRSGKVNHLDSEGISETISSQKLMLMNAGARFYHEELVLEEGGTLEGLQIFIRPEKKGLKPQVQFLDLEKIYSLNTWRKIAGPEEDSLLKLRSKTWILDRQLKKGEHASLPDSPNKDIVFLLYVFMGKISTADSEILSAGDSMLIENERPFFLALETSDLVVFITQTTAGYFDGGMYSGNQF